MSTSVSMDERRELVTPTGTERGPIMVSCHRGGPEIVEAHADGWRRLCDRARPELAFLRPEIVTTYMRAFAPNARIVLLTAHRSGELTALLPLLEKSIGAGPFRFRWLTSAARALFQRFDAIHVDEDEDAIAAAFWRELREAFPRHVLQVHTVLTDGVIARMRGLAAANGCPTQIYDVDGAPWLAVTSPDLGLDDVIAAQGKSLRGSLRRGLRRLGEQGSLRFVCVENEAEGRCVTEWVEQLCELEHAGWKGAAGSSINSDAAKSLFHRGLARDERLRPYFRCMALMLDDEMIAADTGFLIGDTYFGDKMAINERYRDCSPGHLLHLFLLLECARQGVTTLNFGGVIEPYKMYWTDKTVPFSSILIFPESVRGRLLHGGLVYVAMPAKNRLRVWTVNRRERQAQKRLRDRHDAPSRDIARDGGKG